MLFWRVLMFNVREAFFFLFVCLFVCCERLSCFSLFFWFLLATHKKWLIGVIRLQMSHLGFFYFYYYYFRHLFVKVRWKNKKRGGKKKKKEAIGKYRTLPKCQTTFNMAGYWCFRRGTKLRLKIFERGKNTTRADSAPGSVSFDAHTRGLIN